MTDPEVMPSDADLAAAARLVGAWRAPGRVVVVAIDGASGAGKSTFARALAARLGGSPAIAVIEGDDFYAGGVAVRPEPPATLMRACLDVGAQRAVLAALRRGAPARWHAFDWDAFDGSRRAEASACAPAEVVLLEGVYSARPELAALVDLRILLRVPAAVREARLLAREGALGPWERQWHAAEAHYFAHVLAPADVDLVLDHAPERGAAPVSDAVLDG